MQSSLAFRGHADGLAALGLALAGVLVLPSALPHGPVWARSMALMGALAVLVMMLGLVSQTVASLRGGER